MPELDPWQGEDGFPKDEYFEAVADALAAELIDVEHWWRDEPWDVSFSLEYETYQDGPLSWAEHGLYITWRTEEDDEPKHADDFNGLGWYWVPYSKPQTALGDFAKQFELPYLAEPAEVAKAVADLIRPKAKESADA